MEISVEDRIYFIIGDILGTDKTLLKPESRFIEDLNAQSIDILDIMVSCEEEFNIDIDEFELYKHKKIQTVEDLILIVEETIKNK